MKQRGCQANYFSMKSPIQVTQATRQGFAHCWSTLANFVFKQKEPHQFLATGKLGSQTTQILFTQVSGMQNAD